MPDCHQAERGDQVVSDPVWEVWCFPSPASPVTVSEVSQILENKITMRSVKSKTQLMTKWHLFDRDKEGNSM